MNLLQKPGDGCKEKRPDLYKIPGYFRDRFYIPDPATHTEIGIFNHPFKDMGERQVGEDISAAELFSREWQFLQGCHHIGGYIVVREHHSFRFAGRSEEHTSELQSRGHLVCRLLLEKKK